MSTGEALGSDGSADGQHGSSFRMAVERARGELRGGGPLSVLTTAGQPARAFAVKRVRRRGKKDVDRWNELGRDGWELVAVHGKHAWFRREVDPDDRLSAASGGRRAPSSTA